MDTLTTVAQVDPTGAQVASLWITIVIFTVSIGFMFFSRDQ